MSIKVVAFDVHETLIHWPQNRLKPIEVQRVLGRFGIEISYQTYQAARQSLFSCEATKREITGWMDFLALLFARMDTPVSTDLLTAIATMYQERDGMEWYPESQEVLENLRARGLTLCAFTTLPRFMLGPTSKRLLDFLDHYFDCGVIGLPKGHLRFYERITERLGVEPSEILSVGDDPSGDCEVPIEFGWNAVLLDRKGTYPDYNVGQRATISSLTELPRYCD